MNRQPAICAVINTSAKNFVSRRAVVQYTELSSHCEKLFSNFTKRRSFSNRAILASLRSQAILEKWFDEEWNAAIIQSKGIEVIKSRDSHLDAYCLVIFHLAVISKFSSKYPVFKVITISVKKIESTTRSTIDQALFKGGSI